MFFLLSSQLIYFDCQLWTSKCLFGFFNDVYCSRAIVINLFRVGSRMSEHLPLNAKIFYLLTLSNPKFNCYVHMLAMVTSLFLDFTVHFDNFITLEGDWLKSTTKILAF